MKIDSLPLKLYETDSDDVSEQFLTPTSDKKDEYDHHQQGFLLEAKLKSVLSSNEDDDNLNVIDVDIIEEPSTTLNFDDNNSKVPIISTICDSKSVIDNDSNHSSDNNSVSVPSNVEVKRRTSLPNDNNVSDVSAR